jgi:PAS domain S-box-containing protein
MIFTEMALQGPGPVDVELRELRERVARLEREAAERGQRESEERFQQMADSAPVMLWMSGSDTLCTFFNRRWLEFRGRTMEQELGNGWSEGVHADDLERCLDTYLTAFRNRQEFSMEYRLRRADSEYCWIVDTGVPRFLPDGGFAGYIGSGIVVEDHLRKRVELSGVAGGTPLTTREAQLLTLIAEGKSTKEAAALLGISYKTADSHRTRLMEKLNVHETASLVRWAIRLGLVKP